MSKLRLVIKETNDRTPGMEGCVHIEFDNGESGMPYVDRDFAVEVVRRWNNYPELVEALEALPGIAPTDADGLPIIWAGIYTDQDCGCKQSKAIHAARKLLSKLNQ